MYYLYLLYVIEKKKRMNESQNMINKPDII